MATATTEATTPLLTPTLPFSSSAAGSGESESGELAGPGGLSSSVSESSSDDEEDGVAADESSSGSASPPSGVSAASASDGLDAESLDELAGAFADVAPLLGDSAPDPFAGARAGVAVLAGSAFGVATDVAFAAVGAFAVFSLTEAGAFAEAFEGAAAEPDFAEAAGAGGWAASATTARRRTTRPTECAMARRRRRGGFRRSHGAGVK